MWASQLAVLPSIIISLLGSRDGRGEGRPFSAVRLSGNKSCREPSKALGARGQFLHYLPCRPSARRQTRACRRRGRRAATVLVARLRCAAPHGCRRATLRLPVPRAWRHHGGRTGVAPPSASQAPGGQGPPRPGRRQAQARRAPRRRGCRACHAAEAWRGRRWAAAQGALGCPAARRARRRRRRTQWWCRRWGQRRGTEIRWWCWRGSGCRGGDAWRESGGACRG